MDGCATGSHFKAGRSGAKLTEIKDEAEYAQSFSDETASKFTLDKSMIFCFKCKGYGHLANKCPSKKQEQPKVSIKYPEFIHFKTRGVLKGTDQGTWDDFWYISNTTDKHLSSNLNSFSNFKEEFLVEKLAGQRKFLFTYGMVEVWIKNDSHTYLIPGVHYAPEITLNILSMNLLQQQGFEIIFEGDKCILEYMFKDKQGQNLNVDKMRQMHNNYLEDYFDSLDGERANKEGEMARAEDKINSSEMNTFYEFVEFLNLIKNDEIVSKGWDTYRERFDKVLKWFYNHYLKRQLPGPIPPIIHGVQIYLFDLYKLVDCMGGYLSVNFGQEFDVNAEILGLTKGDGEEIKRCYISYLDAFTSYYKTTRAPQIPTKVEEDS
nr:ARID DNA-binding domain-containing protein [Tanacetum cinerariifolium]